MSNFTNGPIMQAASSKLLRHPKKSLLLQHSSLDARSVGLVGTSMQKAGVKLSDILPRIQPNLKVIVVVCEPIKRLKKTLRGRSAADIVSGVRSFERCATKASASSCASQASASDGIAEGAYSLWLRELMRALPSSQLRVVRGEDLRSQPITALNEVTSFLQLDKDSRVEAAAAAAAGTPEAQEGATTVTATQQALKAFYEPFNAELVHLMDGDERFMFSER